MLLSFSEYKLRMSLLAEGEDEEVYQQDIKEGPFSDQLYIKNIFEFS